MLNLPVRTTIHPEIPNVTSSEIAGVNITFLKLSESGSSIFIMNCAGKKPTPKISVAPAIRCHATVRAPPSIKLGKGHHSSIDVNIYHRFEVPTLYRGSMGRTEILWSNHQFQAVVDLPNDYDVLDLTGGKVPDHPSEFAIGKYDEVRKGMYETELFEGDRFIHMGVDIGGPVGTPCMAFTDCEIYCFGYNPEDGDYGHVIITKQTLDGIDFWSLYGHLSAESLVGKTVGQRLKSGEIIGFIGDKNENGGWDPHLHFQLSLIEPETHDLPGVVSHDDREKARKLYPDPRLVLGDLY